MRGRAEALLEGTEPGAEITLRVNPRLMSQLVGQHGENRKYLTEKFALGRLRIVPDASAAELDLTKI